MCFFRPPSRVLFLFCFDDAYKRREGIASTDSVGRAMSLAYFAASTEVGGGEGDRPRLQGGIKIGSRQEVSAAVLSMCSRSIIHTHEFVIR